MQITLEGILAGKELHTAVFTPICTKYDLTHAEMSVLLFLHDNPEHNTATEIVEKLRLTKSHVSLSVRSLLDRGYIIGEHEGKDHRSVHLKVCESVKNIVEEGRQAQAEYFSILFNGFSEEEKEHFRTYILKIIHNAESYSTECKQKNK